MNEITLETLCGEHLFSGCEMAIENIYDPLLDRGVDCNVCLFTFDGVTYEAIEDPDDGYRSYCSDVIISDKEPMYRFPEIKVVCCMDEYGGDILVVRDVLNGKTVLEIGTKYTDDFYPCCHFSYMPENMACNSGKELIMYKMTKSERVEKFEDILRTKICILTPDVVVSDLTNMGYFDAPASTKFHGAFDGGLFAHSLKVAEILAEHTEKLGLEWSRPCSPWIVGLFHDLCKCDDYIRNPQYLEGFMPEKEKWEHNEEKLLDGHGEKSVMLLSQFMTLTEEEILCIRYHMGAYNKDDWGGFDRAIKKYPNVLYTHTADMLASKVCEV